MAIKERPMAQVGRRAASPSPRPPISRPAPTPAARCSDTQRTSGAQVSGRISGNATRCQEASKHTQNEVHHARVMSSSRGMLRPDSSEKKMLKSSGGTYSKPDARVKLIPAEEITYVQHRKSYYRSVGLAASQKRHCRRSITPPPSSRKVSVVPVPSVSPKRLETTENGDSHVREHVTSSATHQISSLKDPAPPSCKSSQPSSTRKWPDSLPKEASISASPYPKQVLAPWSSQDHLGTEAGSSSKSVDSEELLCPTSVLRQQPTLVYYRSVGLAESQERHCRRSITPPPSSHKVSVVPMPSVSPKRLETTENVDSLVGEHVTSSVTHQISSLKDPAPRSCKSSQPSSTTKWPDSLPKEASISASPNPKQVLAPRSSEDHHGTEAGSSSKSVESDELLSPTSVFRQQPTLLNPDRIRTAAPILRKHMLQHKIIPRTQCLQSRAPTQCGTSIKCDTSTEFIPRGLQETEATVILHTNVHKKHYQSEAPWKGNFHVTGELKHICDGIQSHFPFHVLEKVYKASKQMPEILKLEAVALSQLWPKKFKMKRRDGPNGQDIGLYFISSHQRPHRSFDNLLEKISSHIGLWTNIGDTELSIFSSILLSPEYQRNDGKIYFWGIFGKRLRKNQHHHGNHTKNMENSNLSHPNEDSDNKSADFVVKLNATEERQSVQPENGMTVNPRGDKEREMGKSKEKSSTTNVKEDNVIGSDKNEGLVNILNVIGSKETDRINECEAVLGTSNSYPASSCTAPAASLDGCCIDETTNKSTSNGADSTCQPAKINSSGSDLMVDYPPGFSPETERVNECTAMPRTPDSNPASNCAATAASLLNGCCNRDTSNKSTFNVADLMLGKPPDFPKNAIIHECTVVLGSPKSKSAPIDAAAAFLNGCCSHVSANKSTSTLADSPCKPANISSDGSALTLDTPNGCDGVRGNPNSNPPSSCTAPVDSLLSRCYGRDWNKSTFNLPSSGSLKPGNTSLVDQDLVLDTDPGYSLNVPPGLAILHCRTEANNESYVDAPRSLVMDSPTRFPNNIPPGFTESHCRLPTISSIEPETGVSTPVTEKKPLVRFSLNIPRRVKTISLPGFTTPSTVKKEPKSSAMGKATEKLTPTTSPLIATQKPESPAVDTASLLNGFYSHGSSNKNTSSVADSPCKPANISSDGSALMLDTPNGFPLKTDVINGCDVVLGNPNSNPTSSCAAPVDSLLSRCCDHDWNKSTFNLPSGSLSQPATTSLVHQDVVLDTYPAYSINVPPGFTNAHYRAEAMFNTHEVSPNIPPGFTKAHCRTEANLLMDTPTGFPNNTPPGFTEAHRRVITICSTEPETNIPTPVSEKQTLIRFSLDKLVKTESLPGYTTPNTVKTEPKSSAIGKATEKLTPTPSPLITTQKHESPAVDTAYLLNGFHSHGSANKSTFNVADSPCKTANKSSAGSALRVDTPNGFPNSNPAFSCTAPVDSLLSRCFSHDRNKSTFNLLSGSLSQPASTSLVDQDLVLNTDPGYSLNVPPGFRKSHCRAIAMLNTHEVSPNIPPGFTKAHCRTEANLVMGTPTGFPNNIPPGFTEAHRRMTSISSIEPETSVCTPVKKKDFEWPAVDKATEKLTPSTFAFGASSIRKAGQSDGMQVTVEGDENSEPKFPKIRQLSELYGTPQSCTEVCRSLSSNLADKLQATEQLEKRRHQGKRGIREPPEPSLAGTAKRLNVNGQLRKS